MALKRLILTVLAILICTQIAIASEKANYECKKRGLEGRVIWFDADANLWALDSTKEVSDIVAKCKKARINTIVVDIKPLSGKVLYNSDIAPKLTYQHGKKYPAHYDLLKTTINEAKKHGIEVHASVNVFSEGSALRPGGPAFQKKDWQCVQYELERHVVAPDGSRFITPAANGKYDEDTIYISGDDPRQIGKLPGNSFYVRVNSDGSFSQKGRVTGRAHITSPDGGFVLVASGKSASRLQSMCEWDGKFYISAVDKLKRVSELDNEHMALFVNPLNPEVRHYELSIIDEIVSNYDIDGVVLDRMRYPNIYADFSDTTRRAFENYLGKRVENWPTDVYVRRPAPGKDIIRGPLFGEWLKFRAQVMRDFLADARQIVKTKKKDAKLGIYVGAWYPRYYNVGVNWGSTDIDPGYEWWPEGYEETGYAELTDYICAGCYFMHPTREQAAKAYDEEWKSVEAAAETSIYAVNDSTFVYGSLFLKQYKNRPAKLREAIAQCMEKTQGVMLFDLVYVRDYDWWDDIAVSFDKPRKAPHQVPGLKEEIIRTKRPNGWIARKPN